MTGARVGRCTVVVELGVALGVVLGVGSARPVDGDDGTAAAAAGDGSVDAMGALGGGESATTGACRRAPIATNMRTMPTAASTPRTAPTATNARTRESPGCGAPISVCACAGICINEGCGDDTGGSDGGSDAFDAIGALWMATGPEWPEMLAYDGRMRGDE